MKRGGPLKRRTPLPMRSARARSLAYQERGIKAEVRERDGGCVMRLIAGSVLVGFRTEGREVAVPRCYGDPTYHHLHKASAAGKVTAENGVCLCRGHNGWVEDQPEAAQFLGLVVKPGISPATAWRRRKAHLIVASEQPRRSA